MFLRKTTAQIRKSTSWLTHVLVNSGNRFYWDDCFSRASSLAYTTLFALVPITALVFSIFAAFGIGTADFLETVLTQFLPPLENEQLAEFRNQILTHLQKYGQNAAALNIASIVVLIFTSLMLLNTIESALNVVWRSQSTLSIMQKVVSFWAVITLGPLLIAGSLYWNTKVGSYLEPYELQASDIRRVFDFFIPVFISWIALTLLFFTLPATRVRIKDAMFGAFISAVLFEFVKRGFAYYVGLSGTYSKIYGVLATIALFLFWIYLTWCVVLLGAEIAYQTGSLRILSGLKRYATGLGELGGLLGVKILYCIGRNFELGLEPPSEGEIALETGTDPVHVRTCLEVLSAAGVISSVDANEHARTLVRAPNTISLGEVFATFQSKHYQRALKEQGCGTDQTNEAFLNLVQVAARSKSSATPISDWTLSDLLLAGRSTECATTD